MAEPQITAHEHVNEACRNCRHRVIAHNLSMGCLFCSCFSTHTDAAPRTPAERAVEPIDNGEYVDGFTAEALPPRSLDVEAQTLLIRFDDAIDEMGNRERYDALVAVPYAERHPCPIAECNLSAEEHHRLAFGMIAENRTLRRRVAEMEAGQQ